MFNPKYSITPKLLSNIKRISFLTTQLNLKKFPKVVFVELEKKALALSSYSSTSIEGNLLPLTEVKKILKSRPRNMKDSEREVLNYNQALEELNAKLKEGALQMDKKLVLNVHKKVEKGLLPDFNLGKYRQDTVLIRNPKTYDVWYIAPDFADVSKLMEDLLNFVSFNTTILDPLIVSGIFHKQFVIIHPFMDGNGRTARLLTKILLARMGLNTFNLFSFENYYNTDVTKYFQKVGVFGSYYDVVASIDFTEWLEYFTDGIIEELVRTQGDLSRSFATPKTILKSSHKSILKYIKEHGFITDEEYSKITKRAKSTRNLDFNRLIEVGLIERKSRGKATYYILSS